jgi:uncharacterized protein (TIGR02099 family)
MSLASLVEPPRSSLGRGVRLVLRVVAGLAALGASLCLCLWLILYWGILPRLDAWRPQIEAYASRALGLRVQIGGIVVESPGWVPTFQLIDVVLRDAQGREALRLPHLRAALSLPPLLAAKLRFDGLRVDDARLEVRRDAQGRIHVAGLDVSAAGVGVDSAAAADWFFAQREFVLERGVVRWIDEQRAAPPLQLDDVQLVVRNRLGRHDFRLDATPPLEWGERFTLVARARAPLLARPGDWLRWNGTLYATLPRVDAADLRGRVDLPFAVEQGAGALRAWIDWDAGAARSVTLDLALHDLAVRLRPQLQPLALARLAGRLSAEIGPAGVQTEASGLDLRLPDGRDWPVTRLALGWRQARTPAGSPPAPVTSGQFDVDRLDLALLADLAERLPLGVELRGLLARLDPAGQVHDLHAAWDGPIDAPTGYRAKARITGLAIAAASVADGEGIGRPGWRGAELEFSASDQGGEGRLAIVDGAIELPGLFDQPTVPVKRLDAQLRWRLGATGDGAPPRIDLQIPALRFENDDAAGELQASWHTGEATGVGRGARFPGVLELSGKLSRGRATSVARYLPLVIPARVRDWVRGAVQAGQVADVGFRVKGDLADFPFLDPARGDFRIAGQVDGVTLAPLPGPTPVAGDASAPSWPAFSQVGGELVFERGAMHFERVSGRLWGTDLADVKGGIRELGPQSVLEIDGVGHGPASDLLRYAAVSPVGAWLGGALAPASASGPAELQLALQIPIARPADASVRGSVRLGGVDLRLRPQLPALADARGRVDFTQAGMQVAGARARLAGGEVVIDGGSRADGSLHFSARGDASADGLAHLPEAAAFAPWLERLSGQTGYRFDWTLPHGGSPQWQLATALGGLAIDLPAPLGKAADAPLPLRVTLTPQPSGAGGDARDALVVEGDNGRIALALQLDSAGAAPRVVSGALALGAPLPDPVPGLQAAINLPRLDLDAWRAVARDAGAGAAGGDHGIDWPHTIRLKVQDLTLANRHLTRVDAELSRLSGGAAYGAGGWQVRLASDQASGRLTYREPRDGAAAGRVFARLSRLALPPSADDAVEDMLDRASGTMPALDIEIDDFELHGRKLGALAVDAHNQPGSSGDGRRGAWQLDRLTLRVPEGSLVASGQWVAPAGGGRRRMAMDFKLDVADGGDLIERLGFGRLLRGGKGTLSGQLRWQGSPLGLDLPTLEGQMGLALDAGQFVKVEPGAGRLLGVLSLQSLPRRLTLDFRDLFEEGFGFDNASGDFTLAQGSVRTTNLRLRGLQAAVLMEGSADLVRETQDLHVIVVPEINAGTASLAYAAINPAIGLGTFVGQWLLRGPLREAGTREFTIRGSWADPQVVRVARTPGADMPSSSSGQAPDAAPAAPAASAAGDGSR